MVFVFFFKQHPIYFFSLPALRLGRWCNIKLFVRLSSLPGLAGHLPPQTKRERKKTHKTRVPIFIVLNAPVQISVLPLWIITHTRTLQLSYNQALIPRAVLQCVDVEARAWVQKRVYTSKMNVRISLEQDMLISDVFPARNQLLLVYFLCGSRWRKAF